MTAIVINDARVTRNRARLLLAGGLLGVLAVVALVAMLWTPYPVDAPDMAVALQNASGAHWLGTDPAGRDVVSLLMKGLLASFAVPICALALGAVVGVPLGLAASRWPRVVGGVLAGANAMLVLFPAIFAAIVFATLWGASGLTAALALALATVTPLAATTRAAATRFGGRGYVEAAWLAGGSRGEAFRHVRSQIVNLIAAEAVALFAINAALEAALSYLGLGVQPPAHSFGLMLRDAQSYLGTKPLLVVLPGLLLTLLIVSAVLAARGLRAQVGTGESVATA